MEEDYSVFNFTEGARMPDFYRVILIPFCVLVWTSTLVGERAIEASEPQFVIPETQAQISFAPERPNEAVRQRPSGQLLDLAESFSPVASRPSRTSRTPSIVMAAGVANDTTKIRLASHEGPVLAAPGGEKTETIEEKTPQKETILEKSEKTVPEELAPDTEKAKDALLDRPIGFGKNGESKKKLAKPQFSSAISPVISVFGSLLIVVSAFLILALLLKKASPKGCRALPKEVFEDLGRTFISQKLQLHLLRLGNRLILVSVTQDGISPVTEITDPDEVVPLLGMCRRLDANSSSELFRKALTNFSEEESSDYFGHTAGDTLEKDKSAKKTSKSVGSGQRPAPSQVDLYSEPNESLADILASGLATKGGRHA